MQRKFLEDLGLAKDVVDQILEANSADVGKAESERDTYKAQLGEAQKTLKSFEGVDVAELQGKVAQLTSDLAAKDTEMQQKLAERDFSDALKEAVTASGARNAKAVIALLDQEALRASKNQKEDIQKALDAVKKENDFLFQSKAIPRMVAPTAGPNPSVEDKKTQANEALRSLFGKE